MSHINRPGERIAQFRDQTERQASCPGVTKPSFICRHCKQKRGTAGRTEVIKGYSRAGWICGQCVEVGK